LEGASVGPRLEFSQVVLFACRKCDEALDDSTANRFDELTVWRNDQWIGEEV